MSANTQIGQNKRAVELQAEAVSEGNSTDYDDSLADPAERLEAAANRVDRMLQELNAYGEFADLKPLEYRPFPTAYGSTKSVHRAMSSACHTEYDNAESEAALSDVEQNANGKRYRPFPTAYGSTKSVHRAMSSACHTEYDNAESEAALSDVEQNANGKRPQEKKRRRRWRSRKAEDADTESQCSSAASSVDLDPLRQEIYEVVRFCRMPDYSWKSVHSIGYENEYEMQSDNEGLAIEEMKALSRDIRKNFGDFKLATFDDIDQD
ncbi:unnamed protein product [Strongylus vulgaris]|uniref:Uncharacterized protein n=1 Tax=Strongylus vulgaris TaxID=40348 RepID=A0A3P7JCG4_STRVU|nr:unnamed protein product [Strongylus vulgaris]